MNRATIEKLFLAGRIFEPAYSALMRLREKLYQNGFFHSHRVKVPVISIGNLLMGGTGKTPHVIALCRFFQDHDVVPAVVTRGYGGRAGKGPLVVSDGRNVLAHASDAGDEAFMMARAMPGVAVIAGSSRVTGADAAIREYGAEVVILDDGFQHMGLYRECNIVLVPAVRPFGNLHVFPGGELREPLSALKRATCIVITGCEQADDSSITSLRDMLHKNVPGVPVFLSRNVIQSIAPAGKIDSNSLHTANSPDISDKPVFAFCGIGNPESFFSILKQTGFNLCGSMIFKDHYKYSHGDLVEIQDSARKAGAAAIITTAKDGVKIAPLLTDSHVYAGHDLLPVKVLEIKAMPDPGLFHHVRIRCKNLSGFQAYIQH